MSEKSSLRLTPTPAPDTVPLWQAGTLTYTRPALAILFFWLLWGDFCYVVTQSALPSIIPLKLMHLGTSNTVMGLVTGTIPGILNSILNPVISFKSDRYRSRWGRRIPFIFATIPFLVLCLISLAFADKVGFWLHHHLGAVMERVSPETVAIFTIGVLLVVFTFFNSFLTSVFWYLFNDVVPESLLARFMSWFRMISMLSGAFYNFCIFRFADTHGTEILVGAAVFYFFGFGLMCLFVREGDYPPPPAYLDGKTGVVAAFKTFGAECHFTSHYWYQWLYSLFSFLSMSAGAIGSGSVTAFGIFFYMAVGLNTAEIGQIYGAMGIAIGVLILVSGWLADRYHPIRVTIMGVASGLLIVTPANFIWLFWHPGHEVAYWVCMAMGIGLMAPSVALTGVGDPPLLMRLFPRSRFGQFCSTNAIWRAIGGITGGALAGVFLDAMGRWVGKEQAYFYIPLWQLLFGLPGLYYMLKLYQSWKSHGGDASYMPPLLGNAADVPGSAPRVVGGPMTRNS